MHTFFTALFKYIKQSTSYLWLVVVAAYLLFSAGQAIVRNYQSQQELAALQKQLNDDQLTKQRLEALVVYYKTDSYKEKELRRALLLVRPEERVYALPESSHPRLLEDEATTTAPEAKPAQNNENPAWRQWVDYVL